MRARGVLPICVLLLTVPAVAPISAAESQNVGAALQPAFDGTRASLNTTDELAPEAADPALDVTRTVVDLAESISYTIVIGLENGSAGSSTGTPESAAATVSSVELHYNVSVPAREVEVPSQNVTITTPAIDETIHTPPVETPGRNASAPGASVNATVPGLGTPGIEIDVPGRNVSTGPIGTPPVNVSTPPVVVPEENVTADLGNTSVTVQEIDGTLFVANESFPIHVNETTIRLGDVLPPELHEIGLERGDAVNESSRNESVDGQHLHDGVNEQVPGVHEEVEPRNLTQAQPVGNASVGRTNVSIDGHHLADGQTVHVEQEGVQVGTVETPRLEAGHEGVHVADGNVSTPSVDERVGTPIPVDDLGYTGWGEDDDASTYPFVCAIGSCVRSEVLLGPFVAAADGCLDTTTGIADGDVLLPDALAELVTGCYPFYG